MKKFISLLLVMVLALGVLAGCGGGSSNTPSGNTPSGGGNSNYGSYKGSAKDTFKMGSSSEPQSMDPAQSKDMVTWMYILQVYDTLVKCDYSTKEYVPGIATDWTYNSDNTELTFTLRDGVKFHNGELLTADDAVWSLQRALESSFTAQINGSMDHWEKVDDKHIKLVLKYAYAPIMEVLVTPSWGLVSRKAVEEAQAAGKEFGREMFNGGSGAYKLLEWQSGAGMKFERFDDYYAGVPAIKYVETTFIADQSAGGIALENGTLDYFYGIPNSDTEHLKEVPSLTAYQLTEGAGLHDITFNVTDGVFTNKKLRQAIAYAIDREEITIAGTNGDGLVATCYTSVGSNGDQPDYQWYEQDLDKAKQLLAEAGYPNGLTVTFRQDSSKTYMVPAEVMQAQLKKVGINVEFDKVERATWTDMVGNKRQYDATLRMVTLNVNDVDYILTRRLTSDMIGNANNYAGYQNPEFDKLVAQARAETDDAKRKAIYKQCFDIIKEDVPVIPLYTSAGVQFTSNKLKGWVPESRMRVSWGVLYFVD